MVTTFSVVTGFGVVVEVIGSLDTVGSVVVDLIVVVCLTVVSVTKVVSGTSVVSWMIGWFVVVVVVDEVSGFGGTVDSRTQPAGGVIGDHVSGIF